MAASKDTGGQRQTSRRTEETEETEASTVEEVKERHEKLSDDVHRILDGIDRVLEENAEEFVRSYVQKGGQCPCLPWGDAPPPAPRKALCLPGGDDPPPAPREAL